MKLFTAYELPYKVLFEAGALMSSKQDVRIRITLENKATQELVDLLDSMILPFYLLATSGALSGESISPWISTIYDKSSPVVKENIVEWLLKSCNLDERSLVVLTQMLLSVSKECGINEIMLFKKNNSNNINELVFDSRIGDPYPGVYKNLEFFTDIDEAMSPEITIYVTFEKAVLKEAQEKIEAEIFSYVPGLLSGAYGVAPMLPSTCVANIENKIIFNNNEIEWKIARFFAHPSALKGLVNTFASISHKILRIKKLLIV